MSFLRPVLIILVATWHHLGASQDIILKVVEPDPISQQSLCPNQRVVYKCGVVVVSFELSWTLVDKCSLKFTALSNTSDTDSKCDGKFNATLTHKRDISDDQTDGYLFNSTLEIFPPLSNSNGSVLMCTGGTVSKQVKDNATITLSGKPDPPTDLSYSLLESSVELKWNRPSYTGGSEILGMMYNVTANGKTYPVQNGSVAVKYTSPDLIHGDIKVTAINQCEQESMPAIVKIPTAAPPEPTLQLPVLYCDDTLSGGRRVDIKWMFGEMKEGVVYPGEVRVGLSLHPQAEGCSDVLEDATNCTAVITRDDIMYTINLTLSNDVAQTHPVMKMLESSPLKNETQPSSESLIVTLTVSKTCRNAIYTLAVSFGARDSDGNYDSGKNLMMTSRNVVPGKPYSFKVNASVLELESGQVYCYNGSLLGSEGILYVTSGCSEHKSSGPGLSAAQIAGIVLGTLGWVLLLALGVVAVVSIIWYFVRKRKDGGNEGDQKQLDNNSTLYRGQEPVSRQGSERSALDVPDHEYLLTGSSHSGKSSGNKRDKKKRTYSRDRVTKISVGREPITPYVEVGQIYN